MKWNGHLENFARYTENTKDVSEFTAALKSIPQNSWDDIVEQRLVGALGRAALNDDDRLDSAKDLERRLLDTPVDANDDDATNRAKWEVFKAEMRSRPGRTMGSVS